MNDNTKANENDSFTIPMEVLDDTTGELKETIDSPSPARKFVRHVRRWRTRITARSSLREVAR